MEKHEIMDHLQYLQNKVDKMGFKGQNEYDLHLREEISDWLLRQFAARSNEVALPLPDFCKNCEDVDFCSNECHCLKDARQ